MKYTVAADTDVGISKKTNQDSVCIKCADTSRGAVFMAIVCDGMGGLDKGELASAVVIRAFNKWFERVLPEFVSEGDWTRIRASWEKLLRELNVGIAEYASQNDMTLGTTFCGMIAIDNRYMLFNVGDSRAYRLSSEGIEQLTEDQTFVQREIKRGNLTPAEAQNHPKRSILLQCIGASRVCVPDVLFGTIKSGENYLLCSDGFRHMISENEMLEKLNVAANTPASAIKSAIRELIDTVKTRKEKDNISALVIHAE